MPTLTSAPERSVAATTSASTSAFSPPWKRDAPSAGIIRRPGRVTSMPETTSSAPSATSSKARASRPSSCGRIASSGHARWAWRLRMPRRTPAARAAAETASMPRPWRTAAGVSEPRPAWAIAATTGQSGTHRAARRTGARLVCRGWRSCRSPQRSYQPQPAPRLGDPAGEDRGVVGVEHDLHLVSPRRGGAPSGRRRGSWSAGARPRRPSPDHDVRVTASATCAPVHGPALMSTVPRSLARAARRRRSGSPIARRGPSTTTSMPSMHAPTTVAASAPGCGTRARRDEVDRRAGRRRPPPPGACRRSRSTTPPATPGRSGRGRGTWSPRRRRRCRGGAPRPGRSAATSSETGRVRAGTEDAATTVGDAGAPRARPRAPRPPERSRGAPRPPRAGSARARAAPGLRPPWERSPGPSWVLRWGAGDACGTLDYSNVCSIISRNPDTGTSDFGADSLKTATRRPASPRTRPRSRRQR